MFRELRRKKQALSGAECEAVLERGTHGVLALAGDDGYPYAVPLSYLYADGKLVFHCAKAGHKMDAVARCNKASFCVVDRDQVVPEDEGEKRAAIDALARRYFPGDTAEHRQADIDREWAGVALLELAVEHLSGKQATELLQAEQAE